MPEKRKSDAEHIADEQFEVVSGAIGDLFAQIRKLKIEIIGLQSTDLALQAAVMVLAKKHGHDTQQIREWIRRQRNRFHQKILEIHEAADPAAAARLDSRGDIDPASFEPYDVDF